MSAPKPSPGDEVRPQPPPGLGAEFIAELTDRIPQIITDVVDLIREDAPDYAAYLMSDSDDVRLAADEAVRRLVTMAGEHGPAALSEAELAPFEEIGRWEWRAGRTLRTLLGAYRTGARVAWRHLAEVAIAAGVDGPRLAALAEAIFAFIDELSAASARGYVQEQSQSAGERERQQIALAELLLSAPYDREAAAEVAARLEITLPLTYAVVAVAPDEQLPTTMLAARLGPGALPVRRHGVVAALVPDSDGPGRREVLRAGLAGTGAVVGWPEPCEDVAATWSLVELALTQVQRGAIPAEDPTFLDEHLGELVVHASPALVERIAARRLAALNALPAPTRDRLIETLAGWLATFGDRQEMAALLHVHPQTVRYRMGQLRRLVGEDLDDPLARFELAIVLYAIGAKPSQ